jgi:hypothetical protein
MAFLTGCGRSGTTILGRLIGKHPHVYYFNDRFDLWIRPFPVTDIWGMRTDSAKLGSRVALTADDARVPQSALSWFFGLIDHERGDKPVVLEKLAINNFRMAFLAAICPQARFINIVRHGVEVAYSIQQKVLAGEWYGASDRKWKLLVEHAWASGYGNLVALCTTPYHKGLLEWRMSVEAAEAFIAGHPEAPLLHLRYERLLQDGPGELARVLSFLGLPESEEVMAAAREELGRKSPAATDRPIPAGTEELAGDTLRRLGYML